MPAPTKGTIVPLEDKPRKRCRKWRVRKRTGKNPATGRYSERTHIVYGTYGDAEEALERLNDEIARSIGGTSRKAPTVEALCDEFIATRLASGDVTAKTLEANRSASRAYCPHIGKIGCANLTPEMIDAATAAIVKAGTARSTARLYFAKMKLAFDYAHAKGWVGSNPWSAANKPRSDAKEIVPPTEDQIVSLARAMTPDDPYHAAVALGMMAGLRIGEVASAVRGDVSLFDDSMHVRGTKSKSSDAVIPICGDLASFLAAYFAWQDDMFSESGMRTDERTPIVSNALGSAINKKGIQTWWREHREALGLPNARFHDLRHGWANVLLRRKLPIKVISALMRHADTQVTESVYLHPDLDYMRGPLESVSILGDA